MEQENKQEDDLLARLSVATTHQTPGKDSDTKTQEKAPVKSQSDFWNEEDPDAYSAELDPEPEVKQEPEKKPEPDKKEVQKQAKVSSEARKISAQAAAEMQDLAQKAIFTPILNWKYGRKFSEKELDLIENRQLDDRKLEDLEDQEERRVKNKFDRLMKKRDKKIEEVDMTDEEKKDLANAWFLYMEYTQKSMPPGYLVLINSVTSFGSRLVDVLTD